MRWFAAHREVSDNSACGKARRNPLKAGMFALACLVGLGFSAGERFEARADDGGMMAFLLKGNSAGRARAAAPQVRFAAPAAFGRSAISRHAAVSRHKARAARHAKARHRLRHARTYAASKIELPQKVLAQVSLGPINTKVTAQTLALKAAAAAVRPENPHFQDRTLRRGDIVATASGLRVFLGAEHFPYRPRDFAPVSQARHVAQRSALEAMDRSLRGIRVVVHVAKARVAKAAHHAVVKIAPEKRVHPAVAARAKGSAPSRAIALAYAPKPESIGVGAGEPALKAIARAVRRIDLPASSPEYVARANILPISTAPVARRME